MAFKDNWRPRIDNVDDADVSAVNEIADAVISNEEIIKDIKENNYSKKEVDEIFSNALKGTASGETIAISDVSPIEHEMNVKVRGKNLCSETALKTKANGGVMNRLGNCTYDEAESIITLTSDATSNAAGMYGLPFTPEADKYYTFSCEVRGTTNKTAIVGFTNRKYPITLTEEYQKFSISSLGSAINNVCFYLGQGSVSGDWLQFRNVQIEEGNTATDYAPYVDISAVKVTVSDGDAVSKQYDVNADGTVYGVTSLYPTTTLLTDTEGVIFDVVYNRDLNKAFAALEVIVNALIGG